MEGKTTRWDQVSADIFVFVSRGQAPAEEVLRAALTTEDRIYLEVDTPPHEVVFDPGELMYVESVVGSYRIDTVTYHGGTQARVADLLERWYSQTTALADADSDGIFPIPELVLLMRAAQEEAFHPWADPEKRSRGG